MVEQTYRQDVLNLVLAKGYLTKLLENKPIARHPKQRRPDCSQNSTLSYRSFRLANSCIGLTSASTLLVHN